MTESTNNAPERKGVALWVQVIVWIALAGLLIMLALGLRKAQQPMAVVGKPVPDMSFEFYEGYEYQGKTSVKLSDLRSKVVILNV